MPIIKSAKKRVRTARKAAIRNHKTKRSMREALKAFSAKPASPSYDTAQSKLDLAVKKGVIHRNKAARLKSQAAARAKAAGVKPSKAVKTAAKPATKATAKKPTAAKKTAAKASKPATRKPAAKTAKTSSKK